MTLIQKVSAVKERLCRRRVVASIAVPIGAIVLSGCVPALVPGVNPFASVTLYGPNTDALAQANAWRVSRPEDAALMDRIGNTPTARWFGGWNGDIEADVASYVSTANETGAVPILVAYNIPNRDCTGYSAGGAPNETAYNAWIDAFATGIGRGRAVVVLEPDALAHIGAPGCGDVVARYRMIGRAVDVMGAGSNTSVYIDIGHARWLDTGTATQRLQQAGVARARGFSINVSNYITTEESLAYGETIANDLSGSHYIVDTSRNGNGSNGEWCNPPGRALGATPTTNTGASHADALVWIKVPGHSDGTCNGGPPAGAWWPENALELGRNAGW